MYIKRIIITVALFLSLTGFSYASSAEKESRNFEIIKNLDIFNTLLRELDLFYVDSIKPQEIITSAINEMLMELDPYTTYIPESEIDDFKHLVTGEYGGIGALITERNGRIMITDVYENMPAQRVGLKAGDYITAIDGKRIKNVSTTEASAMLKGEPGSVVTVVVERTGEKMLLKKLVRQKIQMSAIDYFGVHNNIGYIYLSGFTEKSAAEVKKALVEMKSKHNLKGLVLDLRGNSGGIIEEAVSISNLFLPKGKEVFSTKGKNTQWDKIYKTTREPFDADIPMVVLVDGESASASEIVAGALQDYDRAVIIGNRTFGKGLIQTTRPVGYNSYLKVTTAKYYTPSGRCIQAIDYENKSGRIADSLMQEFKTAHGRIVKDGGGIMPDITLKEIETLDISYRLLADFIIFDYATQYYQKHPKIESIEAFEFTDEDFENFKEYLKSKDFAYQLRSNIALKSLREIAKIEGYDDIAKEEFDALEQKLMPDTDKDLEALKPTIKRFLGAEIAKRYYYRQGELQQALKSDEGFIKAMEVLNDRELYNKILNP